MTPNRRIFLNIIATYGRSLYALVCGLFTARWVLQALGQVDFGLYGLIGGLTVFIGFFNMLLSSATSRFYAFSVGQAIKAKDEDNAESGLEECRRWFSTAVLLHTVIPCIMIIVGYPIGIYAIEHWLTIPVDRLDACIWVFRFVCISCFVGMINVPFQAMYTAKQYIAELTIYSFVQTTATFGFVWFMASHPGDWLSKYALWMCVVAAVPQGIICFRALKIFPECRFRLLYAWNREKIGEFFSFAFWQAFGALGRILRGQGIQILVNKYFGPSYNATMSIANQVSAHTQTLSEAMLGAFAPAVTTACGAGRNDSMLSLSYKTSKFGMLLSLLYILPLSVELQEVLNIWLVNPPPYLVELCWCVLAMAIVEKSTAGQMLAVSATGKIAAYLAFSGGSLVLSLPIAWFFVSKGFGLSFVGISMLLATLLCSVGRVWFARKIVGMSAKKWFVDVVVPISFVTVVAATIGLGSKCFLQSSFIRICITSIIVVCVYISLAYFFVLSATERSFLISKLCRRRI